MQNQHSKNSYLFQQLLDQQQISSLIKLDEGLLIKFIQHCSKYFAKVIQRKPKKVRIFLANYKQIMEWHSKKIKNAMSVNLSLHFALLFTQHLLIQNNYSYAKQILKQTKDYVYLQGCDLLLVSLCMNNLAILQYRGGKYKKSLMASLQGISIIEEHLTFLHESKNKKRMIEDGVIFVNLLLVAKRNITSILGKYSKQAHFYRHLLQIVNKLGYNFSIKYLGITSIFTSKFDYDQSTIILPVYDESSMQEEAVNENNDFEIRIAKQLDNIYHILKELNLEPEVYYIKEHLVPQKQDSVQSDIKIKEESILAQAQAQPERTVSHVQNIIIDEWNTQLSILKSNTIAIPQKDFEFLGHILFKINKNKNTIEQLITEQNLWKIINVINYSDVLPYQMELKKLTNDQFIKKLLIHYLNVTEEGTLRIHPRAKSLIPPFQFYFCGEKSIIFVNHIRFRKFRVGICPLNNYCQTIYLEIDFKHKQIYRFFKLKEIEHAFIGKLSKKYHKLEPNYGEEQYEYSQYKQIKIANEKEFTNKMAKIVASFEQLLIEQEQNNFSQLSTVINGSQSYNYYQYTQFKEDIGQFHIIKYRANVNSIEINIKNTFKTYSNQGQEYIKGNYTYSAHQFLRDFGINLKTSRKNIAAFSEIILQKFNLKIYEQGLRQEEYDLYQQNAITQIPITSKCFLRKFISFQNYELPITIEIIAINNEKPVAIRITAYEPIKGNNSGLFIYIVPEYWQRPNVKENNVEEESINVAVKRTTQDYNFKKNYFLTNWMQEQGFNLIFNRLQIVNRTLEMRGISSKFILLDEILKSNLHE